MKRTEKWLNKMMGNQFAKGHKPNKTIFKKGMIPHNKGKSPSDVTIEKIRNANIGKKYGKETKEKHRLAFMGEKNPNYKGGITKLNYSANLIAKNSVEYRLWRESVFARDGWICKKCKTKGLFLHPHHIRNFAEAIELRFAIDNGITFCQGCHKLFHHIYKRKNNTKEQVNEFLGAD